MGEIPMQSCILQSFHEKIRGYVIVFVSIVFTSDMNHKRVH